MTTNAELMTIERLQELLQKAIPGPWKVETTDDGYMAVVSEVGIGVVGIGDMKIVDFADAWSAKLIAAAPDLARFALAQAEELARLREELAWFADDKNWYGLPDFESGWFCSASVEGLGRARAALEPAVSTGTEVQE